MVKVATQTPIISLFLLILSLETSFIPSIALNLSVVAFCILFMLYYRRFKMLAWMIILAILPSFANYWAVQLHGDASQAVMLGTRAFVTVCIGLVFVSSISLKELLLYLAQKGLSRSWSYALIVVFNSFPLIQQEIKSLKEACLLRGQKLHFWSPLIVVFNSFPLIQQEIKSLKEACLLRGQKLHFWSPLIYSKVLMTVFRWRHLYLRALSAHGYDEHAQLKNSYRTFYIPKKTKLIYLLFFLLLQTSLFL
ncbi:cobalt ABC transporter domain-containing protein [Streptococcus pneumoniae]|nr:cobalt ABC transporter domain-containing protein [Streptococcus pneumoniae]VKK03719.1 cobalt ABC transporter domain-containing protein [Streptococcus pneumoniae]VKT94352.1 cobalt ABC transporter domain-containing protein [Streptococcus pneumoniae]